MQDRTRNLKSLAGAQLGRLASSNAANRAYDLASRARGAVEQASPARGSPSNNQSQGQGQGQGQSWSQWAWDKLPRRGPTIPGVETVHLFPGWATRRFQNRDAGFTLEVHISGFAASLRPPEQATRSQKAFMAIARRMAALPKLPVDEQAYIMSNQPGFSRSTQNLLQSHESPEQREAEELEALNQELAEMPAELRPTLSRDSDIVQQSQAVPLEELKRMHQTLDMRLQPFWSSSISNRSIILSIFVDQNQDQAETIEETSFTPLEQGRQPLFMIQTSTDAQGVFSQKISIPYERICTHHESLNIAFGGYDIEPKLTIQAELKPAPSPMQSQDESYFPPPKRIATHISVPISNQHFRVISDIDDTIKISDVIFGVKRIFHNVFVRALKELVVPGMNIFYQNLHEIGVRFHYVSNSPYTLLPLLTEFLQVAQLPEGSLTLRFYGGRSLFGGLWEPAGERKRGGVANVLDSFPDSKFFLVGDTGEQDLDLYVELAIERPHQIVGVLLRDVIPDIPPKTQISEPMPNNQLIDLEDQPQAFSSSPTASVTSFNFRPQTPGSQSSNSTGSYSHTQAKRSNSLPYQPRIRAGTDPAQLQGQILQQPQQITPMRLRGSFTDDEPRVPGGAPWTPKSGSQDQTKMTPAERRRWSLDQRIALARQSLPPHILFRVFRHTDELQDVHEVIRRRNAKDTRP